jgi:hypothetical protein
VPSWAIIGSMTERDAAEILADAELLPAIQGSLRDVKRMRDQCLEANIPVAVIAPPGKG